MYSSARCWRVSRKPSLSFHCPSGFRQSAGTLLTAVGTCGPCDVRNAWPRLDSTLRDAWAHADAEATWQFPGSAAA